MPDSNGHGEPPHTRNPLEHLRDIIGVPIDDDFADIPTPTHWPRLASADAADEWNQLRAWVESLCRRFSHLDHHVIPRCWWRHNGHVEALAALRDHERASFSDTAPATGPVDWFRALRDITALLKAWTADLGCGASHQTPPTPVRPINDKGWQTFVTEDTTVRQEQEIQQSVEH
jgi:hypothetical protein